MTAIKREPLYRAAANLRSAASKEWETFLLEAQVYARDVALQIVEATSDSLPTAQGRAQGIISFVNDLVDAPRELSKLEAKRAK